MSHFLNKLQFSKCPLEIYLVLAITLQITGLYLIKEKTEHVTLSHVWSPSDQYSIGFDRHELPKFLTSIMGFSSPEHWGRWTEMVDYREAVINFNNPLPQSFLLQIEAFAYGPNINRPVIIRVDGIEKVIYLEAKPKKIELSFDAINPGSKKIEIRPFAPIAPNAIDSKSSDARKIGVGLIAISIYPS